MLQPFHYKEQTSYWLKVFAVYALVEACIQLLFFIILNNFGTSRISIIEYHVVMLFFQCLMIWPIWLVAWWVLKSKIIVQVIVNIAFYVVYSFLWFGPVQDAIASLYNGLQALTRLPTDRQLPYLDRGNEYSFLNYQLLKHAFRLSWFYLAAYLLNYRLEEKKRIELAVTNKELQLKMLKWHLNPSFYFKTIHHLQQLAASRPVNATAPILQLAKVMEYVIYEAKEKLIDVKKEIQFLSNYIQLKNLQLANQPVFEMEVTGEYQKLKIAPLLLTGIIDEIIQEKKKYKIQLQFSGTKMELTITGDLGQQTNTLILADGTLNMRLNELYHERFSIQYSTGSPQGPGGNQFKLSLILDAER